MFEDADFQGVSAVDKRGRTVAPARRKGQDLKRYYRLKDEVRRSPSRDTPPPPLAGGVAAGHCTAGGCSRPCNAWYDTVATRACITLTHSGGRQSTIHQQRL